MSKSFFQTPDLNRAAEEELNHIGMGSLLTLAAELIERQDESELPQATLTDGTYPGQVMLMAVGTPEEMLELFYHVRSRRAGMRLKRDIFQ